MNLYLVQHGIPVAKEVDPDKPLSEEGRMGVKKMAQFLKNAGIDLDQIWQSGKTRARETAEIIAFTLTPGIPPVKKNGISPMDDVRSIVGEFADEKGNLMIVGHLPHLGKLAAFLTTGSDTYSVVRFQQGGVVCLEPGEQSGNWVIAWMMVPQCLD